MAILSLAAVACDRRLLLHNWLRRPDRRLSSADRLWSRRAAATLRRRISPCRRQLPGRAIPTTRTFQRMARGSSKRSTATKPAPRAAGASDGATPSAASPGGNAGAGRDERPLHRNDGFSSRPILRLLETRRSCRCRNARQKKQYRSGVTRMDPRWSRRPLSCLCCSASFSACSSSRGFFTISSLSCRACATRRAT